MTEPSNTQPEAAAIPVDHADDGESILESDNASSTASLTSSVLAYRKIHGRTYQNFRTSVEYWAPNDEQQNEGLDINHQMMLILNDNKLYHSPIGPHPQRIIDIGTGTGIWAVDFADEHPSAVVIGTDVSPIQPTWVPPNIKFELDDAKAVPWSYLDNHFDFLHMRLLTGSINDWPAVYNEIFRVLKPGGWVEHTEYDCAVVSDDNSQPADAAFARWGPLFLEAGEKTGQKFDLARDQKLLKWMKGAGLTAIKEYPFKLPLGSWPKERKMKDVGNYNLVMTDQSLEGYALYLFTQVLGWSVEETHVYLAKARKELRNKSIHTYYAGITVCGQKPK
jgi:SAM-dependent methyltransferase